MFLILSSYREDISCFSAFDRKRSSSTRLRISRRLYPLCTLFRISPKISPILYSMVSGCSAVVWKRARYGNSFLFTNSVRSSPVSALLWSISPPLVLGTAHRFQRYSALRICLYDFPDNAAAASRSASKSSRYFRKIIHDVCSMYSSSFWQPASVRSTLSRFLKVCSNMLCLCCSLTGQRTYQTENVGQFSVFARPQL